MYVTIVLLKDSDMVLYRLVLDTEGLCKLVYFLRPLLEKVDYPDPILASTRPCK
jgi:hypothetical protein